MFYLINTKYYDLIHSYDVTLEQKNYYYYTFSDGICSKVLTIAKSIHAYYYCCYRWTLPERVGTPTGQTL